MHSPNSAAIVCSRTAPPARALIAPDLPTPFASAPRRHALVVWRLDRLGRTTHQRRHISDQQVRLYMRSRADHTPMDVTERDASGFPAARSHAAVPTFPLRAPSRDFAALEEAEVAGVLQPEAAALLDQVAAARNALPQVMRLHR